MQSNAIVILGPGQLPDGTMLPLGKSRIDIAYQKFMSLKQSALVILSGGKKSAKNSEASAMRSFIKMHYPKMHDALLLEELSIDTLQNAFFSKLIHIDPLGIKKFTVVTNTFHMPRTKQIFTNLFNTSYSIDYTEAPNPEVSSDIEKSYQYIEARLIEFNQSFLFKKDTEHNLKRTHAFIFERNLELFESYTALIQELQPYFIA